MLLTAAPSPPSRSDPHLIAENRCPSGCPYSQVPRGVGEGQCVAVGLRCPTLIDRPATAALLSSTSASGAHDCYRRAEDQGALRSMDRSSVSSSAVANCLPIAFYL